MANILMASKLSKFAMEAFQKKINLSQLPLNIVNKIVILRLCRYLHKLLKYEVSRTRLILNIGTKLARKKRIFVSVTEEPPILRAAP